MAQAAGGPQGKTGAWLSVFLIVAAFILGDIALISENNVIIWVVAGVVLILGGVLALASRIMELGH